MSLASTEKSPHWWYDSIFSEVFFPVVVCGTNRESTILKHMHECEIDFYEIRTCQENEVNLIHKFLNVGGLDIVGLYPIMFDIVFKKNRDKPLTVIFDSVSNANMWFYGLTKLIRLKKFSCEWSILCVFCSGSFCLLFVCL